MSMIEIHHRVSDFDSYRADRVKSLFNAENGCNFDLTIPGVDLSGDWSIGAVVGPSGSGKTSIGRQIFGRKGTTMKKMITDHRKSRGSLPGFFCGLCPRGVHAAQMRPRTRWVSVNVKKRCGFYENPCAAEETDGTRRNQMQRRADRSTDDAYRNYSEPILCAARVLAGFLPRESRPCPPFVHARKIGGHIFHFVDTADSKASTAPCSIDSVLWT